MLAQLLRTVSLLKEACFNIALPPKLLKWYLLQIGFRCLQNAMKKKTCSESNVTLLLYLHIKALQTTAKTEREMAKTNSVTALSSEILHMFSVSRWLKLLWSIDQTKTRWFLSGSGDGYSSHCVLKKWFYIWTFCKQWNHLTCRLPLNDRENVFGQAFKN